VVANISRYVQYVELDLADHEGAVPVEVFGNTAFPKIKPGAPYPFTLGPHSFYWFRLQRETVAVMTPISCPWAMRALQKRRTC
jgi:maltose alpha-D-glucosyltransferase / alpha-amylase